MTGVQRNITDIFSEKEKSYLFDRRGELVHHDRSSVNGKNFPENGETLDLLSTRKVLEFLRLLSFRHTFPTLRVRYGRGVEFGVLELN